VTAAELVVKITADIRGLEEGLIRAAAEIKAFKQDAEGGTHALADLTKQADQTAQSVDKTGNSAERASRKGSILSRTWKMLTSNWMYSIPAALAAAVSLGGLLVQVGALSAAVPILTAVLGLFLMPLTSLAAIVVGFVAPLSVVVGLLGLLGAAFFLSGKAALAANSPFTYLTSQVSILKGEFAHLLRTLAADFMPVFLTVVRAAQQALMYFMQLSHMNLAQAFKSLDTVGIQKLNHAVYGIAHYLARPFRMAVSLAFGNNNMEHQMAGWANSLQHYLFGGMAAGVGRHGHIPGGAMLGPRAAPQGALAPIVKWFNKQDFTATGRRWGNELAKGIVWSLGAALANALKSSTAIGGIAGGGIGAVIGGAIGGPIGIAIGAAVGAGLGVVIGHYLPKLEQAIKHAIGIGTWNQMVSVLHVIWNVIKLVFNALGGWHTVLVIALVPVQAIALVFRIIATVVMLVVGYVRNLWSGLVTLWGYVKDIYHAFGNWQGILKTLVAAVAGPLAAGFNAVLGIVHAIASAISAAVGAARSVASTIGSIHIPSGSVTIPGTSIHIPYATGGIVPGSGSRDSVPAMLTPGEVVLTRRQQLALLSGGVGGGGGHTFIFKGPIIGSNPQLLARELARILQPYLGATPSIRVAGG
jgi:hypothetical protein